MTHPTNPAATPQDVAPAGTALVVDDEIAVRLVTVLGLQKLGYVCETAENGREALDKLDGGFACDVVVTDLNMPVLNGHALCAELLGRTVRPGVIVLTGVMEPQLQEDLRTRGVDRIFFKPFSYRELGAAIAEIIAARGESVPQEN